ncbi:MAG: UvrD-helicase domain-containing protein [Anaerolineales bacterium]
MAEISSNFMDANLTGEQRKAVERLDKDVIVTAGAGTGKTRTLVARYVRLLEEGKSPRRVAAITFTEKAAREMRNRVRKAVGERAESARDAGEKRHWAELEAGMDAARIGTIHSLCSEILRAHPAEAGIDPRFDVIEEGAAAALKARAVEEVLLWALDEPDTIRLYTVFSAHALRRLLTHLLNRRLDAGTLFNNDDLEMRAKAALREAINVFVEHKDVASGIETLKELHESGELAADAGATLATRIEHLLELWEQVEAGLQKDDLYAAAAALYLLRREGLKRGAGTKDSVAKAVQADLQLHYDARITPWLGGEKSTDPPPSAELEESWSAALPQVRTLFQRVQGQYAQALDRLHALDFDDLEAGAMELLRLPAAAERWAGEIDAVLVDEFQDTNERQREIIDALCGEVPGKLFIVGDARQSIYRFRGADVSVFRRVQRDLQARRGEHFELKRTFRTHDGLLQEMDGLLAPILGESEDPERLYKVPYTALNADRDEPVLAVTPPFTEVIVGTGEGAGKARLQGARALARRLLELKELGEISAYDDVALLFRASTGFGEYEEALEDAGIPFVTVAGSGFYDRPEIRDVLNILRALSEPSNDAALAGLLRSPAFGISDPGLFLLRLHADVPQPLLTALEGDLGHLGDADQEAAVRVQGFLAKFRPLVDRMPVAELLKKIVDATDYRAILAASHIRLWRNLDKLLQDAHISGLVRVRGFFEYLRTLREVGAREGEAPAEALGAVRLMTIHKAKGLEFEVVVLADTSRKPLGRAELAYLLPETGPAFRFDRLEGSPLIYNLARFIDQQQSQEEENRILYVAATRARERLILNGHLSLRWGKLTAEGWMKAFLEVLDLDPESLGQGAGGWTRASMPNGREVGVWVAENLESGDAELDDQAAWPESEARDLYDPLVEVSDGGMDDEKTGEPERDWRATGERLHPPAVVVGALVHDAIHSWVFPGDAPLKSLLEVTALSHGLIDPGQRGRAIREAEKLLGRFQEHDVYLEINAASERLHEVPYTRPHPSWGSDSGRIDLLYRVNEAWQLLDFKSDEIRDDDALAKAFEEHRPQVRRYAEAVQQLLGETPQAALCFLDALGEVKIVGVER